MQMKYHPKEIYYENRNGVNYIILDYGDSKVEHVIAAAQQSVHWIGGESAPLPALSTHEVDSIGGADTIPPANQ